MLSLECDAVKPDPILVHLHPQVQSLREQKEQSKDDARRLLELAREVSACTAEQQRVLDTLGSLGQQRSLFGVDVSISASDAVHVVGERLEHTQRQRNHLAEGVAAAKKECREAYDQAENMLLHWKVLRTAIGTHLSQSSASPASMSPMLEELLWVKTRL